MLLRISTLNRADSVGDARQVALLRPFALSSSLSVDDDVASFDIVLFRDKEAREEQLMIVSWMTTNRCNLKCAHCYQNADERNER